MTAHTRTVGLIRSFLAVMVFGGPVLAQSGASIAGRVVDRDGRVVPSAEVVVRARWSAAEYRVLSDESGAFTLDRLPLGSYLVDARGPQGVRAAARAIELGTDGARELELRLDLPAYDEQVVVTAEARPQPIEEVGKALTIVDRDEIARRDEVSVAEVVRRVAGVQVRLDGGPGQLTSLRIRGLRSDASAVLIDGLRFRDVTTTQGDASPFIGNLNVINLDRVEVLRGSASSLYGTNAVGGAINLVSRVGAAQPGGELQLEGGQLGLVRTRGTYNGMAREGRIRYSAGGLWLNIADGIDGHDEARSTGAQGAVAAQLGAATSLSGRIWASDDRVDLNTSPDAFEVPVANLGTGPVVSARPLAPDQVDRLLRGEPVELGSATLIPGVDDPDDERTSSFWTSAVRLSHQTSRGVSIEAHYQRLHGDRRFINRTGGVGFQPLVDNQSDFAGNADTLQALVTAGLGARTIVSGGYEFEREDYEGRQHELTGIPGAFDVGTRVSQDAHAVFGRVALTPVARAHVAGSVRVQAFRLDRPLFSPAGTPSGYDGVPFDAPPTAVTGDLAVSYAVSEKTRLRAHAGNAYRAPSLYERFGGGFSADPATGLVSFTPYGDPRLEPDRYVSVDAGIDQSLAGGRGRLRASWFHAWIQQLTEFEFGGAIDPATDPYGRFAGYLNGDGGRSRGLEVEADWTIGTLSLSSAYTFTDSTTDKALLAEGFFRSPAVARHTFATTAIGRIGEHAELVADLFARSPVYTSLFTAAGSRAYEFPSIVKLDLGGAWTWQLRSRRQLRAQLLVDNVLDREYYELGWLAPGTTVRAGVTLRY